MLQILLRRLEGECGQGVKHLIKVNFFCQVLVGGEASINQMRLKILAQGQVLQTCQFGLFQLNVEAWPGGVPCLHFEMPCVTLSMLLDVSVAVGNSRGKRRILK